MGQFGVETRRWLTNAIKQRKFLVRTNRNHKPQHEVAKALDILETMLATYSYENDLNMARFVKQQIDNIETILPGSGATCHEKRLYELSEINNRASIILGIPSDTSIKNKQYEMEF